MQLLGWSAWAWSAGVSMGDLWSGINGQYMLYRGLATASAIDYDVPVGAAAAGAVAITNYPSYPMAASTVYWFGLRAVNPGGAEESNTSQVLRVETDGDGAPLPLVPNPPSKLRASPKAGGKCLVLWNYEHAGEQITPDHWHVYHDDGTGTMDWGNTVGTAYGMSFLSEAYGSGTTVKFGVRSVSGAGAEEPNTTTTTCVADAEGPSDVGLPTLAFGSETA